MRMMKRLLIVEDDMYFRKYLKKIVELNYKEIEVLEVSNAKYALDLLEDENVDIIITDISMPQMTGVELIEILREKEYSVVIAVVSSYDNFEFVKRSLKAGAVDYLLKHECNVEDITELIGNCIQKIEQHIIVGTKIEFSDLTNTIISYVDENILEVITLHDMANKLGYSENHISKKFKADTGYRIKEYVNMCKIDYAKNLLKEGKYKVCEIAEKLNYTSDAYFCAVFKSVTGVTIKEFILNPNYS